jgi:hypothetical protein
MYRKYRTVWYGTRTGDRYRYCIEHNKSESAEGFGGNRYRTGTRYHLESTVEAEMWFPN